MKKIPADFYYEQDVLAATEALMGKLIVTKFAEELTVSRIVELEAYAGVHDKASHASGGRRTKRNEIMYGPGGYAYVYLCYGIHHLFNIVTNIEGIPHAILVRSAEPVIGMDIMLDRSGKLKADNTITRGPGNFSRAMGIRTSHNGISLQSEQLHVADDGFSFPPSLIKRSARIGVAYAAEDALLPYRYYVQGNPFVSARPK